MKLLTEFIKNPLQTASIIPSSSHTVNELTRQIISHRHKQALKILEIGAGTGVITQKIISLLRPSDTLDVIEINPALHHDLQEKFQHTKNVRFHCCSITEWNPPYTYDVIISTLPFNLFDAALVNSIIQIFKKLSSKGTTVSYIDCFGVSFIKNIFASREKKEDIQKKNRLLHQLRKQHGLNTKFILLNIPPAYVHHLIF